MSNRQGRSVVGRRALKSRLHRGRVALRRDLAHYVFGEDAEALPAARNDGRLTEPKLLRAPCSG